jgi:glycosyltransferase involved in cell wall biosynthesis
MPTRARPEMARRAVECWRRQTYKPTELVIIDDLDAPSFQDGIDERGIHYWKMPEVPIGVKRNALGGLAQGEIVVHWDDDDVSGPGRIADQVARLLAAGAPVTGYHSMRFTDGERWFQYRGSEFYAIGTSLCYRRWYWERNKFPEMCNGNYVLSGEDNIFVGRASTAIVSADAGEMMYATIHSAHTSARQIFRADGTFASNWSAL